MKHLPDKLAFRSLAEATIPEVWHPDVAIMPWEFVGLEALECFESVGTKAYAPKCFVAVWLGERFLGADWDGEGYCIKQGWLLLRPWYRFDGASGPAIDGVGNLLSSAIHDALCDAATRKCKGLSFALADWQYRTVAIAQNAGRIRMWNQWFWLRTTGWAYRLLH